MSRPRTFTRTVLFAETFDFPTPPTWNRQSVLEARRTTSASYAQTFSPSPAPTPEPYLLEPVDSWMAVQSAASEDHIRPITPLRLPNSPSRRPSLVLYPGNKPHSAQTVLRKRSTMVHEETRVVDVDSWAASRQLRQPYLADLEHQDQDQQIQPQHQWPWSHAHAPSPDCPCCASHFRSRWSICSDESRPPSPSSSIHRRLRKMASSTTLRSVRSSIRLRLRASIMQLTRRH